MFLITSGYIPYSYIIKKSWTETKPVSRTDKSPGAISHQSVFICWNLFSSFTKGFLKKYDSVPPAALDEYL